MMSAHLITAAAGTPFYLDSRFWVAVPVVLFIALVIYKGALGSLSKSLDERADKIKAELDEARRLREAAQACSPLITASKKKRKRKLKRS